MARGEQGQGHRSSMAMEVRVERVKEQHVWAGGDRGDPWLRRLPKSSRTHGWRSAMARSVCENTMAATRRDCMGEKEGKKKD